MNFDAAFDKLIKHEGGYSDHAADPGGKTRYGITEAVAREAGYQGDMRDVPLDLAKQIYKAKYWVEALPSDVRYVVFDAAVNSGPAQAAKWLQRACGVIDDGVIGPQTIQAAQAKGVKSKMLAQRLRFMAGLSTWPNFGRGWARRIADLLET